MVPQPCIGFPVDRLKTTYSTAPNTRCPHFQEPRAVVVPQPCIGIPVATQSTACPPPTQLPPTHTAHTFRSPELSWCRSLAGLRGRRAMASAWAAHQQRMARTFGLQQQVRGLLHWQK